MNTGTGSGSIPRVLTVVGGLCAASIVVASFLPWVEARVDSGTWWWSGVEYEFHANLVAIGGLAAGLHLLLATFLRARLRQISIVGSLLAFSGVFIAGLYDWSQLEVVAEDVIVPDGLDAVTITVSWGLLGVVAGGGAGIVTTALLAWSRRPRPDAHPRGQPVEAERRQETPEVLRF